MYSDMLTLAGAELCLMGRHSEGLNSVADVPSGAGVSPGQSVRTQSEQAN